MQRQRVDKLAPAAHTEVLENTVAGSWSHVMEDDLRRLRQQFEYTLGVPFTDGNRIIPLRNGDEIFPAMLEAIDEAERTVDFATFVYWSGDIAIRFADALARQAKRGLRVRVLLDAFGAEEMSGDLIEMLEKSGASVRWFRPLSFPRLWRADKRTHRKILVVDDQTGFTGGVGIAEEWTGDARHPNEWRDDHFRIDGPATNGLKAAFFDNWNEAGEWSWDKKPSPAKAHEGGVPIQIVRASSSVGWTDTATLLWLMVSSSRRTLTLVTPYFVPDERLERLLCETAARGVRVRLLIPGKHTDQPLTLWAGQTSIEKLLASGVDVWLYQRTHLHTKIAVIDGTASCVGSANLNHRSAGKDEECCAVVLCRDFAKVMERNFDNDRQHAEQLSLDRWKARGWLSRLRERAARLIVEQL